VNIGAFNGVDAIHISAFKSVDTMIDAIKSVDVMGIEVIKCFVLVIESSRYYSVISMVLDI
jgi:hypothetical protein